MVFSSYVCSVSKAFKTIMKLKLTHISLGSPTYWPSDQSKIPEVIDFCVTKGVSDNMISSKSC